MSNDHKKAITVVYYLVLFGCTMYLFKNETIEIKIGTTILSILSMILNELINIRYKDEN